MKLQEAMAQRILNICFDYNISINRLAMMSGLTQSTLQSIVDGQSKNPKLATIAKICESLEMPLTEFFNDKIFDNIEMD